MSDSAVPPGKAVRAFVALPLPDALREAVAETITRLERALPDVRFVRPEGVHVTLRFLGWTRAETLAILEGPLRAAAGACPPVEIGVRGLGLFPDRGRPRVLWAGLTVPPEVHALQAACERAAADAGFEPEGRAFRPHLTLGRWRARAPRPALAERGLGSGRVDRLVLYRSEPRPSGSTYTPLSTFPLGGGTASLR
ncbi:MAG TPA: RNA 2',3'-cyclic phosphodiesterase [Vicinamibacteria bacterium]|nr:RNA 2',3'-cyclic phosphodiesterase [Vicinamibacteria bacterium]